MPHITPKQQICNFLCPVLPVLLSLISAEASSTSQVVKYSRKHSQSPTVCSHGKGSFPVFDMLSGSPSPRLICRESVCFCQIARCDSCHFFSNCSYVKICEQKTTEFFLIMRKTEAMRPIGGLWCWNAGDSLAAGFQCVYTLSVVTVVGLGSASVEVWERTQCEVGWRRDKQTTILTRLALFCSILSRGFIAVFQMTPLSNPSPWLSQPLSVSCIELDKSFTVMCQGRGYHCQALGEKPIGMQKGRVRAWKGYPVETGLLGPWGEPSTSPWECTYFHVSPSRRQESIISTMVLQMANPAAQGCQHHSRQAAPEEASREAQVRTGAVWLYHTTTVLITALNPLSGCQDYHESVSLYLNQVLQGCSGVRQ